MPDFLFGLNSFVLKTKRSKKSNQSDTVVVAMRAYKAPKNAMNGPLSVKFFDEKRNIGDFSDPGTYPINMGFQIPPLQADELLTISYVVNNGENDVRINDAFDALFILSNAAALTGNPWAVVVDIGVGLIDITVNLLTPNCDGYLAADTLNIDAQTFAQWTTSGGHTEIREYPGYDSPSGCGANSLYDVSWTLETTGTSAVGLGLAPSGIAGLVNPVSRSKDKLDVFYVASDGAPRTAAWEAESGWRGWWQIADLQIIPGSPLGVVTRSQDKLDVFVVGEDGFVHTAAWEPGDSVWRGWWRVPE